MFIRPILILKTLQGTVIDQIVPFYELRKLSAIIFHNWFNFDLPLIMPNVCICRGVQRDRGSTHGRCDLELLPTPSRDSGKRGIWREVPTEVKGGIFSLSLIISPLFQSSAIEKGSRKRPLTNPRFFQKYPKSKHIFPFGLCFFLFLHSFLHIKTFVSKA